MSNDEMNIEDEKSDEVMSDDPLTDDLFDDDAVEDDVLLDEDAGDDDGLLDESAEDGVEPSADATSKDDDSESEGDTEALDDLEAEELEMLTEDEASETIVVDEATQLRDIRMAQISIEASSAGGATEGEFVCSICFLVKKSSQLSARRRKICLDCAG